jgi:tetratricopeptide (TPR) repeat protein
MYIPESLRDDIEALKKEGKFDEALKKANHVLMSDPMHEDALLQVVDIEYRRGELDKAQKPIDFLMHMKKDDAMHVYIKWVLEMEKNNWYDAKKYFQEAIKMTGFENHEILRCYGLCEYRYGNREKGVTFLQQAFDLHDTDAEVIYNLIEIYLLEFDYRRAKRMIKYFYDKHDKLETFDKEIAFYDQKIGLFQKFVDQNAPVTA